MRRSLVFALMTVLAIPGVALAAEPTGGAKWLKQFGALKTDPALTAAFLSAPIMNNRGERVGEVRPAAGWLHSA